MAKSLYIQVSQSIDGCLLQSLTPSEYMVLRFINERTLRWQKDRERIPMRHFLQGIISKKGELIQAGLPCSKSSIVKAYQSLVSRGFIKQTYDRQGANVFHICFETILQEAQSMAASIVRGLKPARNKKSRVVTESTASRDKAVTESTANNIQNREEINTRRKLASGTVSVEGEESITDKIKATIEGGKKRISARAKKSSTRFNYTNAVAAWKEAVIRQYPGTAIAGVSREEFGRLKRAYGHSTLPIPFHEFVSWAVENWESLRRHELSWATRMPLQPDFQSFTSLYKYFIKAYANFAERMRGDRFRRTEDEKKRSRIEAHNFVLERDLKKATKELEEVSGKAKRMEVALANLSKKQGSYKSGYVPPEQRKEIGEHDLAPKIPEGGL